ncbi:hypothetical protein POAN111098_05575 [Polynucleobacter antarcticus]|uniref:hypothetical protein n=1 Tax=Polynucleobacter antarcticus TaxID=1743162 RepID=UPI00156FA1D1|nr:hypothetical protein [Polynucleobacter antarcticus]
MHKWSLTLLLSETAIAINTCMKQYQLTVRVAGIAVNTVIHAERADAALRLAQHVYGAGNIVSQPRAI